MKEVEFLNLKGSDLNDNCPWEVPVVHPWSPWLCSGLAHALLLTRCVPGTGPSTASLYWNRRDAQCMYSFSASYTPWVIGSPFMRSTTVVGVCVCACAWELKHSAHKRKFKVDYSSITKLIKTALNKGERLDPRTVVDKLEIEAKTAKSALKLVTMGTAAEALHSRTGVPRVDAKWMSDPPTCFPLLKMQLTSEK